MEQAWLKPAPQQYLSQIWTGFRAGPGQLPWGRCVHGGHTRGGRAAAPEEAPAGGRRQLQHRRRQHGKRCAPNTQRGAALPQLSACACLCSLPLTFRSSHTVGHCPCLSTFISAQTLQRCGLMVGALCWDGRVARGHSMRAAGGHQGLLGRKERGAATGALCRGAAAAPAAAA